MPTDQRPTKTVTWPAVDRDGRDPERDRCGCRCSGYHEHRRHVHDEASKGLLRHLKTAEQHVKTLDAEAGDEEIVVDLREAYAHIISLAKENVQWNEDRERDRERP
jgi:hypothetical protein